VGKLPARVDVQQKLQDADRGRAGPVPRATADDAAAANCAINHEDEVANAGQILARVAGASPTAS